MACFSRQTVLKILIYTGGAVHRGILRQLSSVSCVPSSPTHMLSCCHTPALEGRLFVEVICRPFVIALALRARLIIELVCGCACPWSPSLSKRGACRRACSWTNSFIELVHDQATMWAVAYCPALFYHRAHSLSSSFVVALSLSLTQFDCCICIFDGVYPPWAAVQPLFVSPPILRRGRGAIPHHLQNASS